MLNVAGIASVGGQFRPDLERLAFLGQQSVNVPVLPMEYGMPKPKFPKVDDRDTLDLTALRQVCRTLFPCPAPARSRSNDARCLAISRFHHLSVPA